MHNGEQVSIGYSENVPRTLQGNFKLLYTILKKVLLFSWDCDLFEFIWDDGQTMSQSTCQEIVSLWNDNDQDWSSDPNQS